MGSYATVLTERGSGVATAVRGMEDRINTDGPDADALAGRRDDISLQGMATTATAAREAGEGVAMRVMLLWLINIISVSNLAFLTVTEAAAAPQRHLLTRKHQNKFFIILQE
ncbi:hypothetical protein BDFG_03616 [Blastomyces dermatitidis ATCC 26199]|nr:hypothetical protein BDFG_03616 [Blastomyces dermatitidis ATCC 26199]